MKLIAGLIAALLGLQTVGRGADGVQSVTFTVDGVSRTALLYVPSRTRTSGPMPLVFAFHGHGGTSNYALRKFQLNTLWPQAISIYPQGLNTPSPLVDPQGNAAGWQIHSGDQADRDLHFFDAMLSQLQQKYSIDPKRIYCTGHSNGGGFTYLLWQTHPTVFAAVAPCSAVANYARELTPKPALICEGKNDEIVKPAGQQAMIDIVRKINHTADAQPWQSVGTLYPSSSGTPLVTYVYDGGHMMDAIEPGLIVKFFQSPLAAATQP